jgi:hypothetical protein
MRRKRYLLFVFVWRCGGVGWKDFPATIRTHRCLYPILWWKKLDGGYRYRLSSSHAASRNLLGTSIHFFLAASFNHRYLKASKVCNFCLSQSGSCLHWLCEWVSEWVSESHISTMQTTRQQCSNKNPSFLRHEEGRVFLTPQLRYSLFSLREVTLFNNSQNSYTWLSINYTSFV